MHLRASHKWTSVVARSTTRARVRQPGAERRRRWRLPVPSRGPDTSRWLTPGVTSAARDRQTRSSSRCRSGWARVAPPRDGSSWSVANRRSTRVGTVRVDARAPALAEQQLRDDAFRDLERCARGRWPAGAQVDVRDFGQRSRAGRAPVGRRLGRARDRVRARRLDLQRPQLSPCGRLPGLRTAGDEPTRAPARGVRRR